MSPSELQSLEKLILQAAFFLLIWLGSRWLHRSSTGGKPKARSLDEFTTLFLKDNPVDNRAKQLYLERRRRLRRAKITGRVVIALVVIYAAWFPFYNAFFSDLPPLLSRWSVIGWAFFLLSSLLFIVSLVRGRIKNSSRLVLILRRFRKHDRQFAVLSHDLAPACEALAVPITIADSSYPGVRPLSAEAADRWFLTPSCILAPVLVLIFVGTAFPAMDTLGRSAALALAVLTGMLWLRRELLRRVLVMQAKVSNYAQKLDAFIQTVRRKRGLYAGTRTFKVPDDVWQAAVEKAIASADAVVVDVSEISDAVAWEIQTAFRLMPAESILMTWAYDQPKEMAKASRVQRLQLDIVWHQLELADPNNKDVALASETRAKLAELVSSEALDRCRKMRYQRIRRFAGNAPLEDFGALHLCRCFAAREMTAELDAIARQEKAVRELDKANQAAVLSRPEQMFSLDAYYKMLRRHFLTVSLGLAVIAVVVISVSWMTAASESAAGITAAALFFAFIFPLLMLSKLATTYKELYYHETGYDDPGLGYRLRIPCSRIKTPWSASNGILYAGQQRLAFEAVGGSSGVSDSFVIEARGSLTFQVVSTGRPDGLAGIPARLVEISDGSSSWRFGLPQPEEACERLRKLCDREVAITA